MDRYDSYTLLTFISIDPSDKQSIPNLVLFSAIYLDLALETALMGFNPEFSAKTVGISSKASLKALTAYYSTDEILSASYYKAMAQANSQEPPP